MLTPLARTFADELAMELLCRLSPTPAAAADLLLDLATDRHDLVQRFLTLRRLRFDVLSGRVDGRQCLWITERGWPSAQRAAEGYWSRVYGD